MTASEVMDLARTKLNDAALQLFNNDVLLPYLQAAYLTLQSEMQDNSLPTTFEASSALAITAGATVVSTSSTPALPLDIIEPIEVYERGDSSQRWELMDEITYRPLSFAADLDASLHVWQWSEDELKLRGSTANREILIKYIKSLPTISNESTELGLRGALLYLAYKTAAEAAEDIGQNRTKAERLESKAQVELNKFINIRVKGQQGHPVRRRPYGSRRQCPSLLPY
jgi:hypothetical protein